MWGRADKHKTGQGISQDRVFIAVISDESAELNDPKCIPIIPSLEQWADARKTLRIWWTPFGVMPRESRKEELNKEKHSQNYIWKNQSIDGGGKRLNSVQSCDTDVIWGK